VTATRTKPQTVHPPDDPVYNDRHPHSPPAGLQKGKALSDQYFQHTFPNGLTLLCQRMPAMQSAAMTLLVPAGVSTDPVDRTGAATVLSELVLRGAGDLSSRALTDTLDKLGLQRSSSVSVHHSRFACAALAENVLSALPLYADIVQRPLLPPSGFAAACDLALQALAGIDDEPQRKLMIKLREWHHPSPYGRNVMGVPEQIQKLTLDLCKADHQQRYVAQDAILAVAGGIEFEQVKELVESDFGDWSPGQPPEINLMPPPGSYHFEPAKSEQTHIGIAWPTVSETDADYYVVRLAMETLAGGMSGRLFSEIREKRALVYSVGASYSSLKGRGSIFGYAGTSNERAQATLDTYLSELERFAHGITAEELERAKTGLKASTIMSGESTHARAGAIAHDFFIRGRIRTLEEIKQAIDAVTLDQVNAFLKAHPAGPFTVVVVGPKELVVG
jgi:predicted Zn-dependent peptidase